MGRLSAVASKLGILPTIYITLHLATSYNFGPWPLICNMSGSIGVYVFESDDPIKISVI